MARFFQVRYELFYSIYCEYCTILWTDGLGYTNLSIEGFPYFKIPGHRGRMEVRDPEFRGWVKHPDHGHWKCGVFFSVPPLGAFQFHMDAIEPGKLIPASGDIVINQGRRAVMLTVSNRADRPISV